MNRQYGALSGVAVVLIVLNHAIHFGLQIAPAGPGLSKVLVLLQALGVFAVPAFLFVSGAFLAYAAREFTPGFIANSLARILWPYVIWSCVFYALLYVAGGVRQPVTAHVKNLLVGFPYHFVPLLVFWYLAAPALAWIGRRRGGWLIAVIAAGQAWLLAVRFPEMIGIEGWPPAWASAMTPPVLFSSLSDWGVYFPLGLVMSLHQAALKPRLLRWRSVAIAATLAIFGLGLLNAFEIVHAPWARLIAPLPAMFVLPTIDRQSIPFLDAFERLGRRSYGVYLTHFIVLNVIVLALGDLRMPGLALIVIPVCLVAALGLSLSLMDVMARAKTGRRVYRFLFGIVPPPAAAGAR